MDEKVVSSGICNKLFAIKVHWKDNDTLICTAHSLCL